MKGTLFKKLVAGALALLMVGTALPQGSDLTGIFGGSDITASAQTVGGTCGYNANWSFDTETGKLTITGTGPMTSAPWTHSYKDITSVEIEKGITNIYIFAFLECINLASVTIPGTVETIGDYAFRNCDALEKVTIQEGVKEIGKEAFHLCRSLNQVLIPDSVKVIAQDAFDEHTTLYYYGSESIIVPEGTSEITKCDFGLKFSSIVIPSTVTKIQGDAFRTLENLKTIYMLCDPSTLSWNFTDGRYLLYQDTTVGENRVNV